MKLRCLSAVFTYRNAKLDLPCLLKRSLCTESMPTVTKVVDSNLGPSGLGTRLNAVGGSSESKVNERSHISVESIIKIRERYNRFVKLRIEKHKSGNGFSYFMPGFSFDDFNSFGYGPEVRNVSRTFEWSRFVQWELLGGFVETARIGYITLGIEIRLSRALYRKAVISHPLKVSLHVSDIGNSSFHTIQYLRMVNTENPDEDGEILAARRLIHINVDISGQKKIPIPFEKDVKERCQRMLATSEVPSMKEFENMVPLRRSFELQNPNLGITQPENSKSENSVIESKRNSRDPFNMQMSTEAPRNAFRYTIVPRIEDCDLFSHVTLSIYFAYLREAEAHAASTGAVPPRFWSGIPVDPAERLVSRSGVEMKKELKVWEPVTVLSWFDEQYVGVMHFIIKNERGEVASLAFIEYHSSDDDTEIPAKL